MGCCLPWHQIWIWRLTPLDISMSHFARACLPLTIFFWKEVMLSDLNAKLRWKELGGNFTSLLYHGNCALRSGKKKMQVLNLFVYLYFICTGVLPRNSSSLVGCRPEEGGFLSSLGSTRIFLLHLEGVFPCLCYPWLAHYSLGLRYKKNWLDLAEGEIWELSQGRF